MRFERAGVIGAGTMGAGIAAVLASSGAAVDLVEPDDEQFVRALARVDKRTPGLAERIRRVPAPADLPTALDVIVEAVPERSDLKQAVLAAAEEREPRLLGTNTSAISIGELAQGLADPSRLVGLHFFNPVWTMELLEVVRGPQTTEDTVRAALDLAAQLGKQSIVVADRPGFATSRLGVLLGLEAMRMLEDGVASAADLDKAMELGYRHPMGPLRLTDLIGLDIRLEVARTLERAYGDRFAPPAILVEKVARGELGRKTGQGFYRWPET